MLVAWTVRPKAAFSKTGIQRRGWPRESQQAGEPPLPVPSPSRASRQSPAGSAMVGLGWPDSEPPPDGMVGAGGTGRDGKGQDAKGWVPLPGTSSRSEVHLVEAAGNVKSSVYESGLRGLGFPRAHWSPERGARQDETPGADCSPALLLRGWKSSHLHLHRWR